MAALKFTGFDLVARCDAAGWHRIAFVGISKNAGKTTALNDFLTCVTARGETAGLCSVGLDGEQFDTISGLAKPRIFAPEGTVVASAARALESSQAKFEWLEELRIASPLGPIMVARVTTAGNVLLTGVRQRAHVEAVLPRLRHWGAVWCLVDGAFDRVAAAAPQLVDAVILAVGAVAGPAKAGACRGGATWSHRGNAAALPTVADVAEAARSFLRRYQLPAVRAVVRSQLQAAVTAGAIGWVSPVANQQSVGSCALAPAEQALFGLPRHPDWSAKVAAVYLPGVVTDDILAQLALHPQSLELVAAHPAQVLVSDAAWARFERPGHSICVWTTVPLAAVAVNPYHVSGRWLDVAELSAALQQLAGDVPVYSVTPDGGVGCG